MEQQSAFTPYGAPTAHPTNNIDTGQVSSTAIDILRRTKSWVRFLAIIGFIGCGLMLLGALAMIVGMGALASSTGTDAATVGIPFVTLGLIYLVMAALYLYPCIKLNKYASSIGALMRSQSSIDLEAALDAQRSFWKFMGIIMLIFISLYALILIFAFIGGIAGGLTN